VHERQARVDLDRKHAVRRGDENTPPDPQRLGDKTALPFAAADVLDDGVREDDVESAVLERERAGVALHVANARVPLTKAHALVQAERRDLLWPGIELLEEVERRAPVALAEAELVRADVEHGRLRRRRKLVEEEPQLSPSRAE
jgi:hypothetical protein